MVLIPRSEKSLFLDQKYVFLAVDHYNRDDNKTIFWANKNGLY